MYKMKLVSYLLKMKIIFKLINEISYELQVYKIIYKIQVATCKL